MSNAGGDLNHEAGSHIVPRQHKLSDEDADPLDLTEVEHKLNSQHESLFDAQYYIKTNPDVAAAQVGPSEHYMQYGWKEGRNPSQSFDTNLYLAWHDDVKSAGINPLRHYEDHGATEGRIFFEVGSRISKIVAQNIDGHGKIMFDSLYLSHAELYGNCERDWQRGSIALKFKDWSSAAIFYTAALNLDLHNGCLWDKLSFCLVSLCLESSALYAASVAVRFATKREVVSFSASLVGRYKIVPAKSAPAWEQMFLESEGFPLNPLNPPHDA